MWHNQKFDLIGPSVHRIFLIIKSECQYSTLFNRRKSTGTDETGDFGFRVRKALISDTVFLSKYIICYIKELLSCLRGTVSIKMVKLNGKIKCYKILKQ